MFPKDDRYSCYSSPSIRLGCTFSEDPLTAFWTFPANGVAEEVRADTLGHAYSMSEGVLILEVSEKNYSKSIYRCVAFYSDGETIDSEPFLRPPKFEG